MSDLRITKTTQSGTPIKFQECINGTALLRAEKKRAMEHKRERQQLARDLEDVMTEQYDEATLENLIQGTVAIA